MTDTYVVSVGEQGPPGAFYNNFVDGSMELNFAWNDVTQLPISTVKAGKLVLMFSIFITTAFNGTGCALRAGDSVDQFRLINSQQVDPTIVGEYTVSPMVIYSVDTPIFLTITPGSGATQGAGFIKVQVQHV